MPLVKPSKILLISRVDYLALWGRKVHALRSQGRPRRGATEVGRDRIISRLQSVLRASTDIDLSRKTLAELAGVTPALISYYFPKKEVLYEEISRPVMRYYRDQVEEIAANSPVAEERLADIVALLVKMYTKDGLLLEIYTGVMRKTGVYGDASRCELTRIRIVLADLFSLWFGYPKTNDFDATVLQGAIWGMCRFAADVGARNPSSADEVSLLTDRVAKLLLPNAMPGSVTSHQSC